MFDKIILLVITVSSVFAVEEAKSNNPFKKLQTAIDKNATMADNFYYFLKVVGFLVFMFALYNAFVSDNQQKTQQQRFWSSMFMFIGAAILVNFRGFLNVLAS